jgi:tetratricopeptide (TPR) repeat protein
MQINLNDQFNSGITALNEKRFDDAENIFNALLNLVPDDPGVLYHLGAVYMHKKFYRLGMFLFKKSLSFDSDSVLASAAWSNIGYIYREENKVAEARIAFEKAISIFDKNPDYFANLGGTYVAKGEPDKAIEILNRAIELNEKHDVARWNRALAYLEKGNYEIGFNEYDFGTRTEDDRKRSYGNPDVPEWDGSPGKVVVVYGEQGMGDEIMFTSLLPEMIKDCKQVIFDAHPRLADIFRQSFPKLAIYGTRKDNEIFWLSFHKIDAKIQLGSVAKFYRKKEKDFPRDPYLIADPKKVLKWAQRLKQLSDKPKIGISWQGGTKKTNLKQRTIPLDLFIPIFESIDADFISLQYTPKAPDEVLEFEKKHPFQIHHWPDMIEDYDETAALVQNLDLIISVPQTVVHLAGALGVPTFQLTPKQAMWQMGKYGRNMPWYSCVKNFWQDDTESWEIVINDVVKELELWKFQEEFQTNIAV